MAQGEPQDPLLDVDRGGVGHPGATALPGPEDVQPEPVRLALPPLVAGVVDPHGPAGRSDPDLLGQAQQPHPEPEQGIILG
jgi:hypothetical protein